MNSQCRFAAAAIAAIVSWTSTADASTHKAVPAIKPPASLPSTVLNPAPIIQARQTLQALDARLAAAAPNGAQQAAPTATPMGEAFDGSAPAGAANGSVGDPPDGVEAAMRFQGEWLSSASRELSVSPRGLSLMLSMLQKGPTLEDWISLQRRFATLEATREEVWAAAAHAIGSTHLKAKFALAASGKGPPVSPDDLTQLTAVLKKSDRSLILIRNHRFLDWREAWQAGHPEAIQISFQNAKTFLDGDSVQVRLGTLSSGENARVLWVTLSLRAARPGDIRALIEDLRASPAASAAHQASLDELAAQLASLGAFN